MALDLFIFFELVLLAVLGFGAWTVLRHRLVDGGSGQTASEVRIDMSRNAMSEAADLFWQTDRSGIITGAGGRMMTSLIPDMSEIVGQHYLKTVALQPHEMTKMLAALTNGTAYSDIHSRFTAKDGKIHIISLSGTPRYDDDGNVVGYFGLGTDVTERVAAQEELKFLAEHDPLTGLANRRAFETRMNCLLTSDELESFAIVAIDLDGFKAVNDTHGHGVGDLLLRGVADRIRQSTRSTDWAARMGGDEFVFVAEEVRSTEGAAALARRLIEAISEPYVVKDKILTIGASAGVSLAGDPRPVAADLIKQADEALYDAKAAGKGCFRFHSDRQSKFSGLHVLSAKDVSARSQDSGRRMGERRYTDHQTTNRRRYDRKA